MAPREPGPIRAARMLRADLRRAREAAGITQAEVARAMEWSLSKVMRIESGDVGISNNDLRPLAALLGINGAAQRELLRRNESSKTRGWWHDFRGDLSPAFLGLIGLESEVDQLRDYAAEYVPGLLQTRSYAEALVTGYRADATKMPDQGHDQRRLALRMRRQANLLERSDPPELKVVIDESVLYRRVGGAETMAAQMRRLAELSRRPSIEISVLPFEAGLIRFHAFTIVGNELVYVERMTNDQSLEDPANLALFNRQFEALVQTALDSERTGQLLNRVADHYDRGRQPRPWLWE
ncbi:helix-turn-helix transcriptional regulator [Actinoplanes sp. LDG1-06]|uniref:Helix-turn-helix transcriptional regulator n=1 Tax=Paractinoplanes ovalisporus TaxID=2810368 RepID=A0ABS2APE9_9ACTN|nr:helix-turn-helix transcriptional regulator [Actinoplanes ovalisporus]MBM2621640.1 helix-turn-helix transcriptional regulator [Actinoplanes ovalisporus]